MTAWDIWLSPHLPCIMKTTPIPLIERKQRTDTLLGFSGQRRGSGLPSFFYWKDVVQINTTLPCSLGCERHGFVQDFRRLVPGCRLVLPDSNFFIYKILYPPSENNPSPGHPGGRPTLRRPLQERAPRQSLASAESALLDLSHGPRVGASPPARALPAPSEPSPPVPPRRGASPVRSATWGRPDEDLGAGRNRTAPSLGRAATSLPAPA